MDFNSKWHYSICRLNLTNIEEPYFMVEALDQLHVLDKPEDRIYKVVIHSVNQKGRSPRVTLKDFYIGEPNHNSSREYTS